MSADAAFAAARSLDAAGLAEALGAMSEKERRSIAAELQAMTRPHFIGPAGGEPDAAVQANAQVALFGTCIARDAGYLGTYEWFGLFEPVLDVLERRPAKTVGALAQAVMDGSSSLWPVLRGMVRRGLIPPPDPESYSMSFIGSLGHAVFYGRRSVDEQQQRFCAVLAADPALADEWWNALAHEAVIGRLGWAGWSECWCAAVDAGFLDRGHSLDVALDGLVRDLRPQAAGWFRKVYDALEPSVDENAERADVLAAVLSAGNPTAQAFAAKVLLQLCKAGRDIDQHAVGSAVASALSGNNKSAGVAALKLLEAVKLPASELAKAAVTGLAHAHEDVQSRSVKILERMSDELSDDVRVDIHTWAGSVAPSLRGRVEVLVGPVSPSPVEDLEAEVPTLDDLDRRVGALPASTRAALRLDDAVAAVRAGRSPAAVQLAPQVRGSPVVPLRDGDELVETLIVLLSGSGDPIDLERAIDGLARIDRNRASASGLSALQRVIPEWSTKGGWSSQQAVEAVASAAHHWSTSTMPKRLPYLTAAKRLIGRPELTHDLTAPTAENAVAWAPPAFDGSTWSPGLNGFVATRLWEAVTIGLTAPRPTLSLPTTSEGWIAVDVLIDRLEAAKRAKVVPGRFEAVQALLRVCPDSISRGRPKGSAVADAFAALLDGSHYRGDDGLARAARATGGQPERVVVATVTDKLGQSWPSVRFDDAGRLRPRELRRDDPLGLIVDELQIPSVANERRSYWMPWLSVLPIGDRLLCAWSGTALPRHRAFVHALAASVICEHLDVNRASDALDAVITPLAQADEPIDRSGHLLLAAGLSSRNEVVATAATDVLHAASGDGRLDPELLGSLLAILVNGEVAKSARAAARMSLIVRDGPLEADGVRRTLVAWLAELDGLPSDVHAVLETLDIACAESRGGITLARARDALALASAGASKRARLAQQLLALDNSVGPDIGRRALAVRVERAERRGTSAR